MLRQILFVVASAQMSLARFTILNCKSNDDCTQGYSCHNNTCLKCLKCEWILRKGRNCVIDFNDCGECLTGYEEVLLTASSNAIKPCKPVRLKKNLVKHECAADNTCPPNNYCHEKSCIKCFNCNIVHRLSPAGKCARELSDCGSCINGFTEVAVTTDSNTKPCQKATATFAPEVKASFSVDLIIVVVVLIVILFALLFEIFKKEKVSKDYLTKRRNFCPILPSAPPLPELNAAQVIKIEEQECNVPCAVEQIQQAKVFRLPNASYYIKEDEIEENDFLGTRVQDINNTGVPIRRMQFHGEMSEPAGIFVHNYVEVDNGSSVTDSPQQPLELIVNAIAEEGMSNSQETDFPEVETRNVFQGTNNPVQE